MTDPSTDPHVPGPRSSPALHRWRQHAIHLRACAVMTHPLASYPGRLASFDGLHLHRGDIAVCDCGLVAWLRQLLHVYGNAISGAERREPGENHPTVDMFEAEEKALEERLAHP